MIQNFVSSSSDLPSVLYALVSKRGVERRNDSLFEAHEETEQFGVCDFTGDHGCEQE